MASPFTDDLNVNAVDELMGDVGMSQPVKGDPPHPCPANELAESLAESNERRSIGMSKH